MSQLSMIVIANEKGEYVVSLEKTCHQYGTYYIADQECMMVLILPFYAPMIAVHKRLELLGVKNIKKIDKDDSLSKYPMYVSDETILFEIDDKPVYIRIGISGILTNAEEVFNTTTEKFTLSCHPKRLYQAAKILLKAKQHLMLYLCIDAFGIHENNVCYVDIVI